MSRVDQHGRPTRLGTRWASRRRAIAVAALAAALLCAIGTGYYPYARLRPGAVEAHLHVGQNAELAGVRYRLDAFDVAPALPAEDPADPPVSGPAGSVLVLVVVSQTVLSQQVGLDTHTCEVTVEAEPGSASATRWRTESDVTALIRRPPAYGCGDTPSNPLAYGVPRAMGFSFVIPADRAGAVLARLQVGDHGPALALRP